MFFSFSTAAHRRMEPACATAAERKKGAFRSLATSLLAVPGVFKPVADKRSQMSLVDSVIMGWISTA